MILSQITLVGFRNFKEATINLAAKSLLIGPNDIGKTNLIYALRIFLDKSLSVSDIEPKDTDFYAHEDTQSIIITLKFENITEECLRSTFGKSGALDENGNLYLQYEAHRDSSGRKDYRFLAGKDLDSLSEIQGRFYLRHLSLSYVDSNRDLTGYLKREKKRILEDAKEDREEEVVVSDNEKIEKIRGQLNEVNEEVNALSFISSSTSKFNDELKKLSSKNALSEISFDSGAIDPEKYIQDLDLVSKVGERTLTAGGDGRNNQIFLAMWVSRIDPNNPAEVVIYCIEEPEAHLHPHQQRKLAEYLSTKLNGQVILSTHSPQIACEFSPNSLIKLYPENFETKAANNGCSKIIEDSFFDFGHRLNIIPAEAFFSNAVFLVEGVSELLFYKALATKLQDLDLDRLNISIISVEGIGFETYIQIFTSLKIPVVLRTDNDFTSVPRNNKYTCSGLRRCMRLAAKVVGKKLVIFGEENRKKFHNLDESGFDLLPSEKQELAGNIIRKLAKYGIFLAAKDLEQDLVKSPLRQTLAEFHAGDENITDGDLLACMTKKKGEIMFRFLQEKHEDLECLADSTIAKPLLECKKIIDSIYGTNS